MRQFCQKRAVALLRAVMSHPYLFVTIGAVGLWLWLFRGFLSGERVLASDAISYYEHIKFFVENLARGVYPLWDPYFNSGVPNEFFLRRFGSYHPVYLIMAGLSKAGVPFRVIYFSFWPAYYFLGLAAFFDIARTFLRHRAWAFAAALLLGFSSLGTRMFDAYILFSWVPMMGFLAFALRFWERPHTFFLCGMTFCLMIVFTTYIPFYFVAMGAGIILAWVLVNPRDVFRTGVRVGHWARGHPVIVGLCGLAVLMSLIPGALFFLGSKRSEFVLPMRHWESGLEHPLGVAQGTITRWAILEEMLFAWMYAFGEMEFFHYALFYVPLSVYLFVLIGLWNRASRLFWGLSLFIGILFLMGTPQISPVYDGLYRHVFFFKYFRNLHFFLWMGILPALIFLAAERAAVFTASVSADPRRRWFAVIWVVVLHAAAGFWYLSRGTDKISTYLTLMLSALFFVLTVMGRLTPGRLAWLVMAMGLAVIQPIQVYGYLAKNTETRWWHTPYELLDYQFHYTLREMEGNSAYTYQPSPRRGRAVLPDYRQKERVRLYYTTAWFNGLNQSLNNRVLRTYLDTRLRFYDRVVYRPDEELDIQELGRILDREENVVLSADPAGVRSPDEGAVLPETATRLTSDTPEWRITSYTVNGWTARSRLDRDRFLVNTDNYHSDWHAFIDGQEVLVSRVFVSFKGFWIPAGDHTVELRFGRPALVWRHLFFQGFFLMMGFITLMTGWSYIKNGRQDNVVDQENR